MVASYSVFPNYAQELMHCVRDFVKQNSQSVCTSKLSSTYPAVQQLYYIIYYYYILLLTSVKGSYLDGYHISTLKYHMSHINRAAQE